MSKEKELEKSLTEMVKHLLPESDHDKDIISGYVDTFTDICKTFAKTQKPISSEVVSAKEYYEQLEDKKPFTKLTPLGIDDNLDNVFEFATNFSKQDTHTRIEHAKKANAELMEEVVKLNEIKKQIIIDAVSYGQNNHTVSVDYDNRIAEQYYNELSQSETPEAYQKQDEWISVEDERKPKGHCLIHTKGIVSFAYYIDGRFRSPRFKDVYYNDVEYWQPLPNAPKK